MQRDAFTAIADPTRRALLDRLALGSATISGLCGEFSGMSRVGLSKHIYYLEECGLVRLEKRGREQVCHAQLSALAEVSTWMKQYEAFWNTALSRLDEVLARQNTLPSKD